jgi:hypothetical protein
MAKIRFITRDAAGRPIWDGSERPANLPERTTELTAVALWEQVDDRTGRTQCWFEITERDGVYGGHDCADLSTAGQHGAEPEARGKGRERYGLFGPDDHHRYAAERIFV